VAWPTLLFPNPVDPTRLSRDPAVAAAYLADPLVSRRVSARWFTEVTAAIARVHERAPRLSVPVLLMVSAADRIVDPEATMRFARHAPAALLELVRWEGFFHEMFNEPEREEVFRRMDAWLDARIPRPRL